MHCIVDFCRGESIPLFSVYQQCLCRHTLFWQFIQRLSIAEQRLFQFITERDDALFVTLAGYFQLTTFEIDVCPIESVQFRTTYACGIEYQKYQSVSFPIRCFIEAVAIKQPVHISFPDIRWQRFFLFRPLQ